MGKGFTGAMTRRMRLNIKQGNILERLGKMIESGVLQEPAWYQAAKEVPPYSATPRSGKDRKVGAWRGRNVGKQIDENGTLARLTSMTVVHTFVDTAAAAAPALSDAADRVLQCLGYIKVACLLHNYSIAKY